MADCESMCVYVCKNCACMHACLLVFAYEIENDNDDDDNDDDNYKRC